MYIICMRIARTFTIEEELIKKLNDSQNKSELINKILQEYFDKEDFKQMTPEELKKQIKIEKIKKETEKKIKEIENG